MNRDTTAARLDELIARADANLAVLDPEGAKHVFPVYPPVEFEHPCPSCKGTGKRNFRPDPTCWTCGGSGRYIRE